MLGNTNILHEHPPSNLQNVGAMLGSFGEGRSSNFFFAKSAGQMLPTAFATMLNEILIQMLVPCPSANEFLLIGLRPLLQHACHRDAQRSAHKIEARGHA